MIIGLMFICIFHSPYKTKRLWLNYKTNQEVMWLIYLWPTLDPLLGVTNSHTQMPDDADIVLDQGEADDKPKSMSFGKVCLLPGVIPVSGA